MRMLRKLVRTGAEPVLTRNGFERGKWNTFFRYTDIGDIQVVCVDDPGTVPRGTAAEIGVGYSPRHHLEFSKYLNGGIEKDPIPHWTSSMFSWRLPPPVAARHAPERGQPWDEWWELGDRTALSAEVLAAVLVDEVIPELTALESLEAQCAAIVDEPFGKIHVGPLGWAPVYVRLGRAPRAEVEAAIDAISQDEFFGEANDVFRAWARQTLDGIAER